MIKDKIKPSIRFPGFEDDWEQRKLKDLSESLEYGLNTSAVEYDGKHKYLRITDIDDNTNEFIQDGVTSPNIDFEEADKYILTERDVLFARTGASVGKTYLYRPSDGLVYYAGFLIRARILEDFSPEFVFQNTLTKRYRQFIDVSSQRSGQPGVNAKEYGEFEIMVPSLEEQEKLGLFFRKIDQTITLHQRKLDDLKELKSGLLQKMFPQKGEKVPQVRFPGFTGDWEQRKLKDIAERVTRKNSDLETTLPLTISAQYGLVDQETFFNKRVASSDISGYFLIKNGEFAYNKSTSNASPFGAIKRLDLYDKGALSTLYIVFKLNEDISQASDFYTSYFDGNHWHKEIVEIATEGARNHGLLNVSPADFMNIEMNIPPTLEEQIQIGEFFKKVNETITLHQKKIDDLNQLKSGLLQKMFP